MLKKIIFLNIFLFTAFQASAQNDAQSILLKTADACSKVKSASYHLVVTKKGLMKTDTTSSGNNVIFQSLLKDTLIGAKVKIETDASAIVYNGQELFSIDKKTNRAKLLSMMIEKNFRDLQNYDKTALNYFGARNDFEFFLKDPSNKISENKGQSVSGTDCYMIAVALPEESRTEYKTISNDVTILIDKKTFLPVSILEQKQIMFQGKMMNQYKRIQFNDAQFNIKIADSVFAFPWELEKTDTLDWLLKQGSAAPGFSFLSLNDKNIDIRLLKGKPVIVCFWDKDNYNCMKALSVISGLQKKYQSTGLTVIGINASDSNEPEQVKTLLQKRNITFENVLTDDKSVLKNYHVVSFPTTYVIDRSGNVAVAIEGYSEYLRNTLERVIKKM